MRKVEQELRQPETEQGTDLQKLLTQLQISSPVESPFERQVTRGHRSTSDSAKRQISKNPIFISSFEKIVRFLRGQRLSAFRFSLLR